MFCRDYDVAVVGGGIAGVAAAVASARNGAKTALIEKSVFWGGLATSGLIYVYLPICDGHGHQVSFGLAEELMRRSVRYGPGRVPERWDVTSRRGEVDDRTYFSPASFVLALDELIDESNIDIFLDSVVTGVKSDGRRITSLELFNSSGKGRISARVFVDASGDAVIGFLAGEELELGSNALAGWLVEARKGAEVFSSDIGMFIHGSDRSPACFEPGIGWQTVNDSIMNGRRVYREELQRDYAAGKFDPSSRFPLTLPAMPQLRHTRCYRTPFMLDSNMEWLRFDDSVGLAADWRSAGMVWEIPYRTLYSAFFDNLLCAGRCIGSRRDAWEVTRVIPVAAVTGEAAGTAAAVAVATDTEPSRLNADDVGLKLCRDSGFVRHFSDLGLSRPALPR